MSTDIYGACEVCYHGVWITNDLPVFKTLKFDCKDVMITNPISHNIYSYDAFSLLANVRNYEFDTPIKPISEPKGLPEDICSTTIGYLSNGHSSSYVTLSELEKYDDWDHQCITDMYMYEADYLEYKKTGQIRLWFKGGNTSDYMVMSPGEYELFKGVPSLTIQDVQYIIFFKNYSFGSLRDDLGWFITEVMEPMRTLIPDGGTSEDVRLVFDFDC